MLSRLLLAWILAGLVAEHIRTDFDDIEYPALVLLLTAFFFCLLTYVLNC